MSISELTGYNNLKANSFDNSTCNWLFAGDSEEKRIYIRIERK